MPIFLCILSAFGICIFSVCLVGLFIDAIDDDSCPAMIIVGLVIILWIMLLTAFIHDATNVPQKILEDYHKGKIETVTQYQDNTVKVDTTYRYK